MSFSLGGSGFGSSSTILVQEFEIPGDYDVIPPGWAKYVDVIVIGGGGSGGSGRCGDATTNRGGARAGGGGGLSEGSYDIDDLCAALGIDRTNLIIQATVGPGGAGATGIVPDNSNGGAGNVGGTSRMRCRDAASATNVAITQATGGIGGIGGNTAATGESNNLSSPAKYVGGRGGQGGVGGFAFSQAADMAPTGGGGGRGVAASTPTGNDGTHSNNAGFAKWGFTARYQNGGDWNGAALAGMDGETFTGTLPRGCPGPGGGGGASDPARGGGKGGDGVRGGGGGGGGAGTNGGSTPAGLGGKGGDGYVCLTFRRS